MKTVNIHPSLVFALGTLLLALPALSEETVTIPKARFDELMRKEKELERLRGELSATKTETLRLKKEKDEAIAKAAAVKAVTPPDPVPARVSPPMETLPPVARGDSVEAMDLASHYRSDEVAADARYRKKVFKVKGEIIGFDKPILTRNYQIVLRAADRQMRVVCMVLPPAKLGAVFTAKSGTVMMGAYSSGARIALAKLGDSAVLEGRCAGLDGQVVEMSGCTLLSVQSP